VGFKGLNLKCFNFLSLVPCYLILLLSSGPYSSGGGGGGGGGDKGNTM
jgi:hypothetical protein